MIHLGVASDSGEVYEGRPATGARRIQPAPMLTAIRFLVGDVPPDVVCCYDRHPDLLFREDDFDAVTRIRRGRVFTSRHQSGQPQRWHGINPLTDRMSVGNLEHSLARSLQLVTYQPDNLEHLKQRPLPKVVLGDGDFITFWSIVSIETSNLGAPVLTLKARFSLGELPELVEGKVPERARAAIRGSLERVEASINRMGPTEVIDRCRDALSVVFGELSGKPDIDLGPAIKARLAGKDADMQSQAASLAARLHPRGKPNEQDAHGLRPPVESDARLAVQCLCFVLLECEWARWL